MKHQTYLVVLTLLCSLLRCTETASKTSEISYKFVIFPDFCLPKIFFFDLECIKLTMSKFLSVGIMVGSLAYKVPQILTIVGKQSAKGISVRSYVLDTLAVSSNIIYFTYSRIPLKNYGENISIFFQNILSRRLDNPSSRSDVALRSNEAILALAVHFRIRAGVRDHIARDAPSDRLQVDLLHADFLFPELADQPNSDQLQEQVDRRVIADHDHAQLERQPGPPVHSAGRLGIRGPSNYLFESHLLCVQFHAFCAVFDLQGQYACGR